MAYIKLERKLLEWEWFTDPNVTHLWITILLLTNYEERSWQGYLIPKGAFLTSIQSLSVRSGLSVQQVRTALNKLVSTGEITVEKGNKYSLVSVTKWADYQALSEIIEDTSTRESTRKITSTATRESTREITRESTREITTTKEDKKERNIKEEISKEEKIPALEEVIDFFNKRGVIDLAESWYSNMQNNMHWIVNNKPVSNWKGLAQKYINACKNNQKQDNDFDFGDVWNKK